MSVTKRAGSGALSITVQTAVAAVVVVLTFFVTAIRPSEAPV